MSDLPMRQVGHEADNMPEPTQSYTGDELEPAWRTEGMPKSTVKESTRKAEQKYVAPAESGMSAYGRAVGMTRQ